MRRIRCDVAILMLSFFAGPAMAAVLTLNPANTRIGFTAFILGIIPVHGYFSLFSGSVISGESGRCAVTVRIDAHSLWLPSRAMQEDVLSRGFLDPQDYPSITFVGRCAPGWLIGDLTLHGQTHELNMRVERRANRFIARAAIERAKWGVDARPILAGPRIGLTISVAVPPPTQ